MFKQEIKNNCENLCSYFEKIFQYDKSRLAHSIILYGLNSALNYDLGLELARLLNCQKNMAENCDCLNCKWIRENNHPNVRTYSNLENKNDNSKTVISIAQIRDIVNELAISSENKRVYIFCAAKKNAKDEIEHLPLNQDVISIEASNALLKSLEEPPLDAYFIFITKDKNDLLPTIISRSQSFYVHSTSQKLLHIDGLEDIFKYYPFVDYLSSKEVITNLQNWQNDNDLTTKQTFEYVQNYLNELLKSNIENVGLTNRITLDIMKFEDAKNQLDNSFKDKLVWENLTYKIYKD